MVDPPSIRSEDSAWAVTEPADAVDQRSEKKKQEAKMAKLTSRVSRGHWFRKLIKRLVHVIAGARSPPQGYHHMALYKQENDHRRQGLQRLQDEE